MKLERLKLTHMEDVKTHFYPNMDESYYSDFVEDKNVISFVCVHNDEVIGLVYGYLLKRINSKPMLYIHSVDVIKKYQGKGVGTLMMHKILELKDKEEVVKAFLITNRSNEKAMHLYRKVGGDIPFSDDVVYEYK